jgi:hypothetical protein
VGRSPLVSGAKASLGAAQTLGRTACGSSIPYLTALPLHRDARRIADLDPDAAWAGLLGAVHSLGNDALGTEPASLGEHGRPILGDVFIELDGSPGATDN